LAVWDSRIDIGDTVGGGSQEERWHTREDRGGSTGRTGQSEGGDPLSRIVGGGGRSGRHFEISSTSPVKYVDGIGFCFESGSSPSSM
jgi:hypothetical protein